MLVAGGVPAILIADAARGKIAQRLLDGVIGLVGAWMIVLVFVLARPDIEWWSFGAAVALAGVSMIGLFAHELSTDRVVHELNVTGFTADGEPPLAAGRA